LLTSVHVAMYTDECVNLFHPDTGVKSIDEFVKQVSELSVEYIENPGDSENENHDKANSFKGDMFEILSECFFNAFSNEPKVGLTNYTPVSLTEDYGVDAIGINVLGYQCAVQCKFRTNPNDLIHYVDMAKTYSAGRKRHNLPLEHDDTLILITTANDVNHHCKRVFGDQVRVISKDIIGMRVDGNLSFWQEVEQRLIATINQQNS